MRRIPATLRDFLKAYDPAIGRLFFATRKAVVGAAPEATELVYDAYNAVTVAYSFTHRLKEAFCHVAAYPKYVNLGFNLGTGLPDPERLLLGSGTRIRHIRISAVEDLQRPGIQRLLRAAAEQGRNFIPTGSTTVRSIKASYAKKRRPALTKL